MVQSTVGGSQTNFDLDLRDDEYILESKCNVDFGKGPAKINCGVPRIQRDVELVLYFTRVAAAWRHDKTYRYIKKIFKQKLNLCRSKKPWNMSLGEKKFAILRKLGGHHVCKSSEVTIQISKRNNILESDIFGVEALFLAMFKPCYRCIL